MQSLATLKPSQTSTTNISYIAWLPLKLKPFLKTRCADALPISLPGFLIWCSKRTDRSSDMPTPICGRKGLLIAIRGKQPSTSLPRPPAKIIASILFCFISESSLSYLSCLILYNFSVKFSTFLCKKYIKFIF